MPVTLDSYVVSVDELALFTNYNVFKQLCTIDADEVEPTTDLSGARLDRAHQALNWAKSKVDSLLNKVYAVPFSETVTDSYPALLVKEWTVGFARIFLFRFHIDRTEQLPELIADLEADIDQYTKPGGLSIPGHERTTAAESAGRYLKPRPVSGSIYDRAGYFSDDIIRQLDGDNRDGT